MHSKLPLRLLTKCLLKTPHYIPVVSRALLRKHIGVKSDLRRNDGFVNTPPLQISLRITNKCNQRCAICGQFGERGYMNTPEGAKLLKEIPVAIYKKIADEVAHYRPIFYITGGEAFLYKGLMELTSYIKQKNSYVYVVTNGSLVAGYSPEIVKQEWDMITISFDGPETIHDKCRGVPGSFKAVVGGIRSLLKERRHGSKNLPYIVLSMTLSAANQDYIEDTFRIAADLRPDCLLIYFPWFTTEEIGKRHADILKQEFGVEAITWQSYIGQTTGIEPIKIKQTFDKLSAQKWPFDWLHIPGISFDKIPAYFQEPENYLGYGPCLAPYLMVDIMPNGDVVTCRDYIDVKVGNIAEKPLLEIWNDEPFRRFRTLLRKHGGLLPQCSRCCGLMGF